MERKIKTEPLRSTNSTLFSYNRSLTHEQTEKMHIPINHDLAEESMSKEERVEPTPIAGKNATEQKIDETCQIKNEEAAMIKEHYIYVLSQILCPDFKTMINWNNLSEEHVEINDETLHKPTMKNFIILVALKLQQLSSDLSESESLARILIR